METKNNEEKQGKGPLSAPTCSPFTRCSACNELYFGGSGSTPCCGGMSIVSAAPAWAEAVLPLLDLILQLDPTTKLGASGVRSQSEIRDIRDQMEGASLPIEMALEQAGNVAAHALGSAHLTVADPKRVPQEIAVCPECGGGLWWQVTTSDGLRDLDVDCEYEEEMGGDTEHRSWQSEWQPVLDAVRRWLGSGGSSHTDTALAQTGRKEVL